MYLCYLELSTCFRQSTQHDDEVKERKGMRQYCTNSESQFLGEKS